MTGRALIPAAAASLALAFACSERSAPKVEEPQSSVTVNFAPIMTGDVLEVTYQIVGLDSSNNQLWSDTIVFNVTATSDSEASGSSTYPCTSDLASIDLTILRLVNANGATMDPDLYGNPGTMNQPATCSNGEVSFSVTISGIQYGIEVDVVFEDIFCSAKFDCLGEDGEPLIFLHHGDTRSTTVILALACTAGPDGIDGPGDPTFLHMNEIYVACDDGSRYWIDPTDPEPSGQGGPVCPIDDPSCVDPLFYEHANYRGRESLPFIDKCFWNVALGIDVSQITGNCHLEASGTASSGPLAADPDPNTLQLYPYIHWSIDLTDIDGIACGLNPLGGVASGTTVEYLELTDTPFKHTFECQNGTTTEDPELCTEGFQIPDLDMYVTTTVNGFYIDIEDNRMPPLQSYRSDLYAIPEGMDIPECCPTPCVDCIPNATP